MLRGHPEGTNDAIAIWLYFHNEVCVLHNLDEATKSMVSCYGLFWFPMLIPTGFTNPLGYPAGIRYSHSHGLTTLRQVHVRPDGGANFWVDRLHIQLRKRGGQKRSDSRNRCQFPSPHAALSTRKVGSVKTTWLKWNNFRIGDCYS